MSVGSSKKVLGVIPARLHSTRFPKKILSNFHGKPMVCRTAEKASQSRYIDRVIIAIDDLETFNALKGFPFELIMTSKQHQSGTDRVAETMSKVNYGDIVVNIQADEPFIDSNSIDSLVQSFEDSLVEISTLVNPKLTSVDLKNPSVVKAVIDEHSNAIDFLRSLDLEDKNTTLTLCKHIGIYGFTRATLNRFITLNRTTREKDRSLEQMRALDNHMKIKAVFTNHENASIDTEEDYLAALKKGNFQ